MKNFVLTIAALLGLTSISYADDIYILAGRAYWQPTMTRYSTYPIHLTWSWTDATTNQTQYWNEYCQPDSEGLFTGTFNAQTRQANFKPNTNLYCFFNGAPPHGAYPYPHNIGVWLEGAPDTWGISVDVAGGGD